MERFLCNISSIDLAVVLVTFLSVTWYRFLHVTEQNILSALPLSIFLHILHFDMRKTFGGISVGTYPLLTVNKRLDT